MPKRINTASRVISRNMPKSVIGQSGKYWNTSKGLISKWGEYQIHTKKTEQPVGVNIRNVTQQIIV